MKHIFVWSLSYICWLAVVRIPGAYRLNALLPWAGLYGHTEGGWREFRDHASFGKGLEITWDASR